MESVKIQPHVSQVGKSSWISFVIKIFIFIILLFGLFLIAMAAAGKWNLVADQWDRFGNLFNKTINPQHKIPDDPDNGPDPEQSGDPVPSGEDPDVPGEDPDVPSGKNPFLNFVGYKHGPDLKDSYYKDSSGQCTVFDAPAAAEMFYSAQHNSATATATQKIDKTNVCTYKPLDAQKDGIYDDSSCTKLSCRWYQSCDKSVVKPITDDSLLPSCIRTRDPWEMCDPRNRDSTVCTRPNYSCTDLGNGQSTQCKATMETTPFSTTKQQYSSLEECKKGCYLNKCPSGWFMSAVPTGKTYPVYKGKLPQWKDGKTIPANGYGANRCIPGMYEVDMNQSGIDASYVLKNKSKWVGEAKCKKPNINVSGQPGAQQPWCYDVNSSGAAISNPCCWTKSKNTCGKDGASKHPESIMFDTHGTHKRFYCSTRDVPTFDFNTTTHDSKLNWTPKPGKGSTRSSTPHPSSVPRFTM